MVYRQFPPEGFKGYTPEAEDTRSLPNYTPVGGQAIWTPDSDAASSKNDAFTSDQQAKTEEFTEEQCTMIVKLLQQQANVIASMPNLSPSNQMASNLNGHITASYTHNNTNTNTSMPANKQKTGQPTACFADPLTDKDKDNALKYEDAWSSTHKPRPMQIGTYAHEEEPEEAPVDRKGKTPMQSSELQQLLANATSITLFTPFTPAQEGQINSSQSAIHHY
ncbi:hypothetical protein NP233_g12481 [Leucocoprinus birnbaumii]|uniref:Uncharacterized protein n=1 Tax=Leucocoprinus birnbaumii TaxID=56174 RepID=A0AAD5VJZ8_9AGAR|nr:hypothetical protein NP233_g12481 [Leucocoprinus birnbaumii]